MKSTLPIFARISLALVIPGLVITPTSFASLGLYDGAIEADHGDGAEPLPYAAVLTTPAVFDSVVVTPFDFGSLIGPATIELIIEGDPEAGGQNGYIGQGSNTGNSLRFEQWNNTGTLGFTRSGVADYEFGVPSPTVPTHVTYRWDGVDTMDLFIDGALAATVPGATFEMPMGPGLLGNVSDGGNEGMIGTIHRITTYDSALDAGAIQSHANAWLSTGDPSILAPGVVDLALDGTVQSFDLTVANLGQSNVLNITSVDIGGTDMARFAVTTPLPLNIDPGDDALLEYTFDPMGAVGAISATFTIFSNDLLNDEATVQLSGLILDPFIEVAAALDLGISDVPVTGMLEVQNAGGTQTLNISGLDITGPDADRFGAVGPESIPPGGSGNIDVTFTPDGTSGGFDAQLEIGSDDPGSPVTIVALSAITALDEGFLLAYDSVIAADHGAGGGPIPYNAVATTPFEFDTTNSEPFDFGAITGDATFEFILEGDPAAGGRDGFLAVGENSTHNLRYEQWDDTGVLGFTTLGVEDYVFDPFGGGDPALLNSPESPTHVAYVWQQGLQTMNLYVDGTLAGTHVGSNFEMATGQGFLGNNAAGSEGMLGTIHRVTIYNNDIGEDNVSRHAQAFLTGAGASDFQITDIEFDSGTGMVTITWNSVPGAIYAVFKSFDLEEWEELDDSVFADGASTAYPADGSLEKGASGVFFQIRLPE